MVDVEVELVEVVVGDVVDVVVDVVVDGLVVDDAAVAGALGAAVEPTGNVGPALESDEQAISSCTAMSDTIQNERGAVI